MRGASKQSSDSWLLQFDYLLLLFVLAATALGLVVMRGGTYDVMGLEQFYPRQMQWWKISVVLFFVAAFFPYRWLRALGWPLYLISLVFLGVLWLGAKGVLNMGFLHAVKAGGAYLWLKLELGGFVLQFQPAELCKISMTIAIAAWVAWRRNHLDKAREGLIPLSLMAIPFGAIAIQPDVGTAIILAPVPFVILFAAGLRWRIVLTTVGVGLLVMVSGLVYFMKAERVPFLRQYHHDRIHVFLEPLTQPFKLPGVEEMLYGTGAPIVEGATDVSEQRGDDWNIRQAEMALGSGRLFGKGWGKGTQSRYRFLPEHHTDFIFCSLGEQFGLAGCLLLIILYVLIGWRALRIAVLSTDPFGKFMVVGLILIFFLHIFLNIGMMVRLLPVAGLPLPLMSYGGTFLASNYLMFGLMASVGMRRRKKDFMKDHVGI